MCVPYEYGHSFSMVYTSIVLEVVDKITINKIKKLELNNVRLWHGNFALLMEIQGHCSWQILKIGVVNLLYDLFPLKYNNSTCSCIT